MKEQGKLVFLTNEIINTKHLMGLIDHAFKLAFYSLFLVQKGILEADDSFFYFCMKQVMSLGGDVDTNCCIVGGLAGAMVGVANIDKHFLITCLECDISKGRQTKRPKCLQPA